MDGLIRLSVLFSGRVQGVGFRYTTRSVARGFKVGGYVRNLPDGRVELVAEGSPDEAKAFLEAVRQDLGAYIREVQVSEQPASGDFEDFSVRY